MKSRKESVKKGLLRSASVSTMIVNIIRTWTDVNAETPSSRTVVIARMPTTQLVWLSFFSGGVGFTIRLYSEQ